MQHALKSAIRPTLNLRGWHPRFLFFVMGRPLDTHTDKELEGVLAEGGSLRERLQLPKQSFGGDRTPRRKRLKRRMAGSVGSWLP